ncbi:hypothetical protein CKO18_15615 [Rhodoferax fermentans]|nr:hypothetical protein [Rhodoferax fermentans]
MGNKGVYARRTAGLGQHMMNQKPRCRLGCSTSWQDGPALDQLAHNLLMSETAPGFPSSPVNHKDAGISKQTVRFHGHAQTCSRPQTTPCLHRAQKRAGMNRAKALSKQAAELGGKLMTNFGDWKLIPDLS